MADAYVKLENLNDLCNKVHEVVTEKINGKDGIVVDPVGANGFDIASINGHYDFEASFGHFNENDWDEVSLVLDTYGRAGQGNDKKIIIKQLRQDPCGGLFGDCPPFPGLSGSAQYCITTVLFNTLVNTIIKEAGVKCE